MSFNFPDIRNDVNALLRDDALLVTLVEKDRAINGAIRQLNHDKPLTLVKDIPGDNTQDYALPSEFTKGFSDLEEVETPAGQNPPVFRNRDDDWRLYEDPTKPVGEQQRLRFLSLTPSATNILTALDVDTILFQSGNTIRYTFNTTPDLSGVSVGNALLVTGATKSSNNGNFFVSLVDNGSDFIEVTNPGRSDNTDDEASDSPAVADAKTVDIIRVTFKSTNTVTNTSSTLNQDTFQAIIYKALVFLFRSLAARFNESNDPSILADSVDLGAKAQGYLFLAERYENSYNQITGLKEKVKAGQAMAEADIVFAHGEDFLFHPARSR